MGNIRPSFIKIRARLLLEKYPDFFNDNFENNKVLVSRFTDVSSKRLRNWIAGYVTRLVANQYRREGRQRASQEAQSNGSPIQLTETVPPPEGPVEFTLETLIQQLGVACEADRWHSVGDFNPNSDGVAGDVLENFLGVETNNFSLPDYGGIYELKTHQESSSSLVTLFHLDPNPRPFTKATFTRIYGWPHRDRPNENRYSFTSHTNGDSRGFYIEPTQGRIYFRHDPNRETVNRDSPALDYEPYATIGDFIDQLIAKDEYTNPIVMNNETGFRKPSGETQSEIYWDVVDPNPSCECCRPMCEDCENVESRIRSKLQRTVYVEFQRRVREDGQVEFNYNNAWLLSTFSLSSFNHNISINRLRVDLNLRTNKNHGCSFRIRKTHLTGLFDGSIQLIRNHEIVPLQGLA